MSDLLPLRIVHISDPHFARDGAPGRGHGIGLAHSPESEFLNHLRAKLRHREFEFGRTEDEWPKVLIVSGDLVDKGADDVKYERAAKFIGQLADVFRINKKERVFVVPGNHDVDWSGGASTPEQRLKTFLAATQDFRCPGFRNGRLMPEVIPLLDLRDGVPLELTLFTSPTFTGVADLPGPALLDRLQAFLGEGTPLDHRIAEMIQRWRGPLDIAALGADQTAALQSVPNRPDPGNLVRIAVLHHHLVPDPTPDMSPFSSVLDAGIVLDLLIRHQYDLVLHGHRHMRRWAQYRNGLGREDGVLDISAAPSLFGNGKPGFTVIDVYGASQPYYAILNHYDEQVGKIGEKRLVHRDRILADVAESVGKIDKDDQRKVLMPILRSFGDVRQGTISRDAFTLLWNEAFEQVKEIATQQELVFGATRIWKQWEKLIQLAAKTQGALHLVSDDDLKFWEDSSDPLSPAWNYRSALKDFPGVKWRVLVIDPTRLREADFPEQLIHVVTAMIDEDRFRVSIADKNDITPDTETDFGIIADIAVSRFVSKGSRTLIERFSREEINRARKHWESILTARKWDSEESRQPVETWVAKSR